jgi:hypothetical protein
LDRRDLDRRDLDRRDLDRRDLDRWTRCIRAWPRVLEIPEFCAPPLPTARVLEAE